MGEITKENFAVTEDILQMDVYGAEFIVVEE